MKLLLGLRESRLDQLLREIDKYTDDLPDHLRPYSERLNALYVSADRIAKNILEFPGNKW